MRVIQFKTYGGPEVLEAAETAMPEAGSGEVRVKTAAVGVNPADWKWRAGWFTQVIDLPLPHIPGYDMAGVVDAVGPDVTEFAVGDRVAGATRPDKHGAYAEYVVLPTSSVAKIPAELDFATAAALPTPALTGVQLVEELLQPRSGQTVLVTGAVGGVGRFALRAAKQAGARVIAAGRASHAEEARSLGADDVIVLGEPVEGLRFDLVADTVGGPDVAALCRFVDAGGKIGTVATTPIDAEGLAVSPTFFGYHADGPGLARIAQDVASGDIAVPAITRMPLSQAAEAQRLIESGEQKGKIVLEP